jgi:hypothetical protein
MKDIQPRFIAVDFVKSNNKCELEQEKYLEPLLTIHEGSRIEEKEVANEEEDENEEDQEEEEEEEEEEKESQSEENGSFGLSKTKRKRKQPS